MKYNVGSLFAGVGGICLGFKNAKYENKEYNLIFSNEIDEYACETYRLNFNHSLIIIRSVGVQECRQYPLWLEFLLRCARLRFPLHSSGRHPLCFFGQTRESAPTRGGGLLLSLDGFEGFPHN